MNKDKWTKGEWKFKRPYDKDDNYSSIESENGVICLLPEPHFIPDCGDTTWYNGNVERLKSHAQLICAAPDMYKALTKLKQLKIFHSHSPVGAGKEPRVWTQARKAIAKAEGKI